MKRPIIYNYLDYRSYLGDMFHFRKQSSQAFSYRFFSRRAGFASPNFLKLVIIGQRNLTNTSVAKVAKGFGLKKQERDFLENLVFMNQARAHDEKNHYYRKMISIRGYTNIHTIEKAAYEYFSKWYYPVIRELINFDAGNLTPKQIASTLNPEISTKEVEAALRLLEKLKLICKDASGHWKVSDRDITTGPEVASMIVANFHKEMLKLATQSIDRFPAEERDISGLVLSVRRDSLPELKSRLVSFRRELIELAGYDDDPDSVIQINMQLFPLTK